MRAGGVWFAPTGTPLPVTGHPGTVGWEPLGQVTFVEPFMGGGYIESESLPARGHPARLPHAPVTLTYSAPVTLTYSGPLPPALLVAVCGPRGPRKGPGLTGRKYRQARRRWRRIVRAARRDVRGDPFPDYRRRVILPMP